MTVLQNSPTTNIDNSHLPGRGVSITFSVRLCIYSFNEQSLNPQGLGSMLLIT